MSEEDGETLFSGLFMTYYENDTDEATVTVSNTVYKNAFIEKWRAKSLEDEAVDHQLIAEREIGDGTVALSSYGTEIRLHVNANRPQGAEANESCTFGVIWGAAKALMLFLGHASYTITESDGKTYEENLELNEKMVLELGAGTGALGLWVAKHWPDSRVIITDLPMALGTMEQNISLNNLENAKAKVLSFGEDPGTLFDVQEDSNIDVILCSDLLYTHFAEPLCWNELAETLALAMEHNPASIVWFMLAERYGTRDISPFFHELEKLLTSNLSITELELSDLWQSAEQHPADIDGLFHFQDTNERECINLDQTPDRTHAASGCYPYRMRFFRISALSSIQTGGEGGNCQYPNQIS